MSWENYYVLAIAILTIALLALEKAHLSTLGVGIMVAVAAPGLVSAEQAIGGLANPALVTIAALFIVGEAFMRSGAASIVADKLLQHSGKTEASIVLLVMVMAAVLSAFVNNTLIVITFLPVITTICRDTGILPSRLLIPLSYASILGGMCTLVGTSTNLLVSGALGELGENRLEMFTITPAGLLMAGVGLLYILFIGRHLLPSIPSLSTQMTVDAIKEYVMEVSVGRGSQLIGKPANTVGDELGDGGAKVMMVVRKESLLWPPFAQLMVEEGDILMLGGSIQALTELQKAEARANPDDPDSYDPGSMSFFELGLGLSSDLVGRKVGDIALKRDYGAVVVAVQRAGRHIRERVSTMALQGGDVLLVFGDERSKTYLRHSNDFHVIEGVQESIRHTEKAPWAFAIILMVVALFVTGATHYSTAALIGALAMTLTGCLSPHETHRAVKWPIIMFIAGMLALSSALQSTGTTAILASGLEDVLPGEGIDGAYWLLGGLLVATVILTEFLTNNAVAVLLTPLAVEIAAHENLDPWPLVMAVALGASACFANPMGYQTNIMVKGPGGYRFSHFIKVGLPLDLLLIVTGFFTIPWFWPLQEAQPKASWSIETGEQLSTPLASVAPGTRLSLNLTLPEPMHVYAASYSPADGHAALFPSAHLNSDLPSNPLPAALHVLPGHLGTIALRWPVPADAGSMTYMVVISRRPRQELLAGLAWMEQMGNGTSPDGSMGKHAPRTGLATAPKKGAMPQGLWRTAFDINSMQWGRSVVSWEGENDVFLTALKLKIE